jgi:KDO2-lipid IV(A) lauroyltransferase
LKNNEVVCVIADEEARKGGVFVDFFGYQVPTPKGPAFIAARSGAEVLPAFIYRGFSARHRIVIEPPVDIPRDDTAEAVEKATAIMTKIIENVVRKYPEEWAWITHRWRKRLDKSRF